MKFSILNNMRECLVLVRDPRPGDSLMHLPAICGLAKEFERVNVIMVNKAIQELAAFPDNVFDGMRDEPRGHRIVPVFVMGVSEAIGFKVGPDMPHPTVALMRWAGLECDDIPKQPRIGVADTATWAYDVVFAPWSSDSARRLTVDQACEVLRRLRPLKCAIIGAQGDSMIYSNLADIQYDMKFADVAHLMLSAKVVATMDSFPGRLAHAAGVKNHIAIHTGAMPVHWATHPGATDVVVDLKDFKPEAIVEAIHGFIYPR